MVFSPFKGVGVRRMETKKASPTEVSEAFWSSGQQTLYRSGRIMAIIIEMQECWCFIDF